MHKFCSVFLTKIVRQNTCLVLPLFNNTWKNSVSSINMDTNRDTVSHFEKDTWRLPSFVRPGHYNLMLHPDLKSGLFKGYVQIDFSIKQPTNVIKLNTKYLDITDVKLFLGVDTIPITKFYECTKSEQLLIELNNTIKAGNYKLNIDFNGDLTKGIVGLYLSRLDNVRTMVASKFEPTYARQAFPCFDEPEYKATYDVTLVKPASYVALSNMNEISRTTDENTNLEKVTFATSVPMSTYLACFVICDFTYKEVDIDTNGIGSSFKLRSFAQKNETHKIDFAQDIGKRATEFYIKYYEVPFPLPKLDMIAIPDYSSGATEHWGLITYRETQFLVDSAKASAWNKIAVANTIAHELAHMWFGNLVTMKWWDDLWLNEGFASYMQVKSLNALEPSWTMLDQFLTKNLHSVLATDAKLSSHPIVQTVATPDQITAIFDIISYSKGASILRMLEGFIGEENFRKGVSDYLQKYRYGNTVTQQMLTSLEPYFNSVYTGLSLSHIMDTWTRQMGYPLVTVSPADEPNTYVITQSRFLLDPDAVSPNDSVFKYRWYVPITYKTNNNSSEKVTWFPDTANNVKISIDPEAEWFKINNNQVGYYRVNYTSDMWHRLTEQLKNNSQQLTISDRAHLLNDVFALAQAQIVHYELALNLSTYLSVERDYVPWDTASGILNSLSSRMLNSLGYTPFQKFVQRLILPVYNEQSWESSNTSVIDRLFRATILKIATKFGLPDAENKVRSLFLSWLNSYGTGDAKLIDPDLRDFVYFYGMRSGSQAEWDKLWQIYLNETDVQEQSKLRSALTAPRDVNILRRFMLLALDETKVRSQDYISVLTMISFNPAGTALVWDDVRARWPQLVDRFSLNSRYLGNMIPSITQSFNTEIKLKEMESFFSMYPEAGAGERSRASALETVANNIKWTKNNEQTIIDWLKSRYE